MKLDVEQALKNWIPYRLTNADNLLNFNWLYVADRPFAEPFFDETIGKCQGHPHNSTRWRPTSQLSGLLAAAGETSALQPDAFIFHVSRCGSTLLSQLLSIPEQHIVLSEMQLIDDVLRIPYTYPTLDISPEEQDATLKAVIKWMGIRRTGREQRLFIKLDSWHFAFYDTFRRLYPTVPFVFLYRSPDDVLLSHQKHRGMHAVPGLISPELFGLTAGQVQSMSLDEYTANVLESYFRSMLNISETDANIRLLNYQKSGLDMLNQLANALNLEVASTDWERMQERSQYHSKRPGQVFQEDRPEKPLPHYLETAMSLYHTLDVRRAYHHQLQQ
ncbi:sulfotransferase family protein [Spirosoma daeguense]